jgi:SAM-dependent methyltransferase
VFRAKQGNGDHLETGAYEGIICSSVVEFVPDAAVLLGNFSRALRPGGTLILSYSNKYSLWRVYAAIRRRGGPHEIAVQHNIWSFREARAALHRAHLAVTSGPVFFEADPFDRRPRLRFMSSYACIGTLGMVTARRSPT